VLSARKNPAVERALLDKLQGSDPDAVRRAIGALVELKNAGAVPYLIDLAKGKDPSFVREIIFALGEIGGDEAEAYLYTVAEGHDQPAVRAAAQKALDELRARTRSAGRSDSKANRPPTGGSR
jgi:HEAT repeat protein